MCCSNVLSGFFFLASGQVAVFYHPSLRAEVCTAFYVQVGKDVCGSVIKRTGYQLFFFLLPKLREPYYLNCMPEGWKGWRGALGVKLHAARTCRPDRHSWTGVMGGPLRGQPNIHWIVMVDVVDLKSIIYGSVIAELHKDEIFILRSEKRQDSSYQSYQIKSCFFSQMCTAKQNKCWIFTAFLAPNMTSIMIYDQSGLQLCDKWVFLGSCITSQISGKSLCASSKRMFEEIRFIQSRIQNQVKMELNDSQGPRSARAWGASVLDITASSN